MNGRRRKSNLDRIGPGVRRIKSDHPKIPRCQLDRLGHYMFCAEGALWNMSLPSVLRAKRTERIGKRST